MPSESKSRPLPSGLATCWMMWRHCCCTYGFYPLAVAPIVTVAFLLSVYSSSGCHFIEVDVGFAPTNRAWNESELDLGIFFQYRPDLPDYQNGYQGEIHSSCHPYSTAFEEDFTDMDRTWKAARIMSYIATSSGLLALIIAWAIVVFPLPSDCLWPGLLLPCIILAFIGEGSKFLLLDIALCRIPIWFPTGVDSPPKIAESCMIGDSAYAGIVAGVLQGIGLLMVCLKAPDKRHLDPDFGAQYHTGDELNVEESDASYFSPRHAFAIRPFASFSETRQPSMDHEVEKDETSRDGISVHSQADSDIASKANLAASPAPSQDERKRRARETYFHQNGVTPSSYGTVSESRLSIMSKMEKNASTAQIGDDIVHQLISDLDASFNGTFTPSTAFAASSTQTTETE